jgi:hypothetical protein
LSDNGNSLSAEATPNVLFESTGMPELLGISAGTVMIHRHNLRDKLGLKNKKINLRSYPLSLE